MIFNFLFLKVSFLFLGGVAFDEFQSLPTAAIDQYMNDLKEKHPRHRERFSNQAWLHQAGHVHPVLKWLRKRYGKLMLAV